MQEFEAVLFDMDGLLLDSETFCLSTFLEACRESRCEPDIEVYYRCIGSTFPRTREILREGHGPDFPLEAILRLWEAKFREGQLNKPLPLKPGARDLLQYLHVQGMKKAVVTSTATAPAETMLSNAGLTSYFDFVLGGDRIKRGKPDPQIYLEACRQLGENPADCLALEDSDNGVLAAYRAGVKVIQVPDMREPSPAVITLGHHIVKSLAEVENLFRQSAHTC